MCLLFCLAQGAVGNATPDQTTRTTQDNGDHAILVGFVLLLFFFVEAKTQTYRDFISLFIKLVFNRKYTSFMTSIESSPLVNREHGEQEEKDVIVVQDDDADEEEEDKLPPCADCKGVDGPKRRHKCSVCEKWLCRPCIEKHVDVFHPCGRAGRNKKETEGVSEEEYQKTKQCLQEALAFRNMFAQGACEAAVVRRQSNFEELKQIFRGVIDLEDQLKDLEKYHEIGLKRKRSVLKQKRKRIEIL